MNKTKNRNKIEGKKRRLVYGASLEKVMSGEKISKTLRRI